MKNFSLLTFLTFLLGMTSCISNECEELIREDYPEIIEFLNSNKLPKHTEVICNVEVSDSMRFNGYQEPHGKCSFFDVKLEVGNTQVTKFIFQIDGSRQYDIFVYEFDREKDLKKFKEFIPSASLFYEKNKEIHEFFEAEDKVYLYYYGFP